MMLQWQMPFEVERSCRAPSSEELDSANDIHKHVTSHDGNSHPTLSLNNSYPGIKSRPHSRLVLRPYASPRVSLSILLMLLRTSLSIPNVLIRTGLVFRVRLWLTSVLHDVVVYQSKVR